MFCPATILRRNQGRFVTTGTCDTRGSTLHAQLTRGQLSPFRHSLRAVCTVLLDPRDPLLHSESTQGFAADPDYWKGEVFAYVESIQNLKDLKLEEPKGPKGPEAPGIPKRAAIRSYG